VGHPSNGHILSALTDKHARLAGEIAERLAIYGRKGETTASIKNKLMRCTFAATFLPACIAALKIQGVNPEDP
jgi:hypothetical protein